MSLTYDEISSQFDAMKKTAAYIDEKFEAVMEWITAVAPKQVVFLGCGSSYSVSKSLADMAYMHLHINARALPAGDVLLHAKRYSAALQGALIVSISRSGSTSEIVRAIYALRENGCVFTFLSVSGVADSPLDYMADRRMDMPWIFDESVCQTRTVSCLYFTGIYFISKVTGEEKLRNSLINIVARGPVFLQLLEDRCKGFASGDWDRVVALGDAEISGLCEEGALAFAEICQIPSNFYHLLDSRHGPMVLISKKTLVIAAISDAENAHEINLLNDIVSKGARVIAVSASPVVIDGADNIYWAKSLNYNFSDFSSSDPSNKFSAPINAVPDAVPIVHAALGFPFILTCQLIAYYKSFHTGADPDSPDGLDPWIKL